MVFLLLCILANVIIFLAFRSFRLFGIHTLQAIVVNYVVCIITGFLFIGIESGLPAYTPAMQSWIPLALAMGMLFVTTFYMMALTTQRVSVTVATLAAKMSLIIPVIFSLVYFESAKSAVGLVNYFGIGLSLFSIVLTAWPSRQIPQHSSAGLQRFTLPILVFVCSGAIDTSLNFTNQFVIKPSEQSIFPVFVFASAAVSGIIWMLFRREAWQWKSVIGGIYLGIPNYFAIYFLLRALDAFGNNGALIFPGLNMGIILVSACLAFLIFKERLSRINLLGMFLAALAMLSIFYG
ncbi:MAG: hypothetical protein ACFCUU_02305 [Cyclobacteriaceae bacterium]